MSKIFFNDNFLKKPFHKKWADTFLRTFPSIASRFILWSGKSIAPFNSDIVLRIESTNFCNYKCTFCPHEYHSRKKGIMEFSLFKKIIDESIQLGTKNVNMTSFGESFIDKKLIEKMTYAKKAGIPNVYLTTNGSLIRDEKTCEAVVKTGINEIRFSLDAVSDEVYLQVRKGATTYKAVIENVERLIEVRNRMGSKTPLVTVNFVKTEENKDQVATFVDRWKQKADHIHIQGLHNWADMLDAPKQAKSVPCKRLWYTFSVFWNGEVAICCADVEGKHLVGDVSKSSLKEAWNSSAFQLFRRKQLTNDAGTICASCNLTDRDSLLWIKKVVVG